MSGSNFHAENSGAISKNHGAVEVSPKLQSKSVVQAASTSALKSAVESQMLKQFSKGAVQLLDGDGNLTSNAVSALQLSQADAILLQRVISDHRLKLSQEAQKHLQIDQIRSNEAESAFIVKAFPEQGLEIKKSMMNEAAAVIGAERGKTFAAMFPRLNFGGDFGTLEVQIKTKESGTADLKTGFGVAYETVSPETGLPYGGGSFPLSKIYQQLGVHLEIQQ